MDFEKIIASFADATIDSTSAKNERTTSPAIDLKLKDGTKITANFWRLIMKDESLRFSSFDHLQRYDFIEPVDAVGKLSEAITGKKIIEARLTKETGDLELTLEHDVKLQIFNLSNHEVWEVLTPDGKSGGSSEF